MSEAEMTACQLGLHDFEAIERRYISGSYFVVWQCPTCGIEEESQEREADWSCFYDVPVVTDDIPF